MKKPGILFTGNTKEFYSLCKSRFNYLFNFVFLKELDFYSFSKELYSVDYVVSHVLPVELQNSLRNILCCEVFFVSSFDELMSILSSLQVRRKTDDDVTHEEKISSWEKYLRKVRLACEKDTTVLLLGETGSGKGFTARFIHDHSSRKNRPFKKKNLAEVNPNLVESEIFGTVRGAYTGCEEKSGLLGGTEDGTLFLDEIGELSRELQVKLYGVLDNRKYSRVGEFAEHEFRGRFFFATNESIQNLVGEEKLKKEFFYRINVFIIEVPPLRDHKWDIKSLAQEFAMEYGKTVSEKAIEKMMEYNWPGNVRQLKNCIERGAVYSDGDVIHDFDIEFF